MVSQSSLKDKGFNPVREGVESRRRRLQAEGPVCAQAPGTEEARSVHLAGTERQCLSIHRASLVVQGRKAGARS